MVVFPNAKINIGLHIVSRRSDGYHDLETIFYPVGLSDALEMAETGNTGISFSGLPVDGQPGDNLVMKAYRMLERDFGLPPVQFHLHKVIPPGAGLGGGSSDAAFTLNMLNAYFRLHLSTAQLKKYASLLGADCAFFIDNQPAYATGTGDRLTPVALDLYGYKLVIVKPRVTVYTARAYQHVTPAPPVFRLGDIIHYPVEQWEGLVTNDFEKSIFPLFPEIEGWKKTLYELGAVYASMSGSGSSVFALFREIPSGIYNKIPKSILFVC
jgi:4-diphosphocytidyl-2-C-methyl-D-erythritol kinase